MKTLILCIIIFVILWSIWGYFASRAESALYTVIEKRNGYEIREYSPHVIAQTTITGDYDQSMNSGFRIIAGYIFGGNTKKESIATTVPVTTQIDNQPANEKIAMTVPVTTTINGDSRIMSFVMPSKYTIDSLPTPNDSRVQLIEVASEKKAALRFSWFRTESRIERNKIKLQSILEREGITLDGPIEFAAYNGPGTPPWMNRHEILVRIK